MNNPIDELAGRLATMRLVAEGALSIYEQAAVNDERMSLIGDALYFLRETIDDSLKICQAER